MASIASLCERKGWQFTYITKTLSQTVKHESQGNLALALKRGMELIEMPYESYEELIVSLYSPIPDARVCSYEGDLLLAQGGADLGAKEGIKLLAEEVKIWKKKHNIEKLTVVTPSGTGTTALYLATYLNDIKVLTTPVVGSESYLREQMLALSKIPRNLNIVITSKKYHFAKPYREYIEVYKKMQAEKKEIDLLYAPKMLMVLEEVMPEIEGEILYIHSGGLQGNPSMLARYQRKGWL